MTDKDETFRNVVAVDLLGIMLKNVWQGVF